ncbi:PLG [Branchiostoma lanceolatum]|uniref:PLG protein n=1 Tax=Branchiostoma lanceolatum TaxID=7740 RepID=A0A8K0EXR0_BRALA|nr:PLG [Branchiostoma lanceolatum]
MKRSCINLETAYGPGGGHGDPSIPNTSGENSDGENHPNLSAATDVTVENGSDVSGNDAVISAYGSDEINMPDIRLPPSALNQNQICEPEVCSEPAHRPANSDVTPSIEPLTAAHLEGHDDDDSNKLTTSGAAAENDEIDYITHDIDIEVDAGPSVRPKSTPRPANNALNIKPYAVRYQTHDENRGGTPYAVRHQEDDEDEIPYAVRYQTHDEIRGGTPYAVRHQENDEHEIPYAVRYQTHGENRGGTPYAVRHQEDDEDEMPYAARYQTHDENLGGMPYAVRRQEDDENGIPPEIDGADGNKRKHPTVPSDVDITPYAVAYKTRYDMTDVTRRDTPMNDADTSDSVPNDKKTLHHQDPSSILNSLIPNPMYVLNSLIPNPMYVPNVPQHAAHGCSKRRVGDVVITIVVLALLVSGGTLVGIYFNDKQDTQTASLSLVGTINNTRDATQSPTSYSSEDVDQTPEIFEVKPERKIPVCMANPDATDFRGNLSVTQSGKTCQRWDVDFPHSRRGYYLPEKFPELVENYCRNPNGNWGTMWCYPTDPNTPWEYCIHPACPFVCVGNSTGSDYRGNVSVTISGKTCQRWDVDFPHRHDYTPEEYPELVKNYCRNPDESEDEPGLWCYTKDNNTRWEYCFNPACP